MDVVVVLSVCTVTRAIVANSDCMRNVPKCNASSEYDPISYTFGSLGLVARMDCLCVTMYCAAQDLHDNTCGALSCCRTASPLGICKELYDEPLVTW